VTLPGTEIKALERDLGELVARHDRARDLRDFGRWKDDPVGFIRDVLHGQPWHAQEAIAHAVRDHPLVVVRSANAVGKDWVSARLALWWVYARRGLALVTGPTERQVVEVVMGELGRAWRRAKDLPGELYRTALRVPEAGGLLAYTSTESSRLTGFHAPRVLAILTEAQGVEDFAFEGLLACATGAEDRVLAVGNPLAPSGRFFAASRPSSGWHALRIAASEHPNIVQDREVIPGGPSQAFVQRIAKEYGHGSGVYLARVEGEFPQESEDALCARSWVQAANDRWASGEMEEQAASAPVVLSLDPARYGPDESILLVKAGPVVREIIGWRKKGTAESAGRVLAYLDEHELSRTETRVVVDEPGLGGGVLDALEEQGANVKAYNGGRKAGNPKRFLNTRAQAFWKLRKRLECGQLALPEDEKLSDELCSIRWRVNSSGLVQIEPKDRLRARIGRSCDRADALAAALWAEKAVVPTVGPIGMLKPWHESMTRMMER
jgi:hypothetical protein